MKMMSISSSALPGLGGGERKNKSRFTDNSHSVYQPVPVHNARVIIHEYSSYLEFVLDTVF